MSLIFFCREIRKTSTVFWMDKKKETSYLVLWESLTRLIMLKWVLAVLIYVKAR